MHEEKILALVTTKENRDRVGGSVFTIFTDDEEEMQYVAALISRITVSMVHDLGNGIYMVVKH